MLVKCWASIYPSLPEYTSPFKHFYATLSECNTPPPPPQNTPLPFHNYTRPSQNLPLPFRIYPLFQQLHATPLKYPPFSQNIPPTFKHLYATLSESIPPPPPPGRSHPLSTTIRSLHKIYPSFPDYTPTFLTPVCNHPRNDPSRPEYTPFPTTICDAPCKIHPSLLEYTPLFTPTLPESTTPFQDNTPPPFSLLYATLPESTPPSQSISPPFEQLYAALPKYTYQNVLPTFTYLGFKWCQV